MGFLELSFIYFYLFIVFGNEVESRGKVTMQRLSLLNCLKIYMFLSFLGKHPKVGSAFKTNKRAKGVLKTKEEMVNNRVSACQKRFFQKIRSGSRRKWERGNSKQEKWLSATILVLYINCFSECESSPKNSRCMWALYTEWNTRRNERISFMCFHNLSEMH